VKRAALLLLVAACGGAERPETPRAPTCTGEIVVTSEDALATIAGCRRLDGSLVIRGGASFDLTRLDELEVIAGDLTIGPTFALETITLTGVREVGGAVHVISNAAANGASLPALERAGSLEVAANVDLGRFVAPRLRDLAGDLTITDNPDLELLQLGALARVGGAVSLTANPSLQVIEIPTETVDRKNPVP
jgi:hypothetical protein